MNSTMLFHVVKGLCLSLIVSLSLNCEGTQFTHTIGVYPIRPIGGGPIQFKLLMGYTLIKRTLLYPLSMLTAVVVIHHTPTRFQTVSICSEEIEGNMWDTKCIIFFWYITLPWQRTNYQCSRLPQSIQCSCENTKWTYGDCSPAPVAWQGSVIWQGWGLMWSYVSQCALILIKHNCNIFWV